ncbi:MAG: Mov34/MPN/PAD-1 family protein [Candidatus Lokiarchaeota archaeon]|nr:Mov34/MPN/PAD-1 family protein [Candidatus Lokiarchaeota archaeon]
MRKEKDVIIYLKYGLLEKIKDCVNNATPNEACGFVFGTIEEVPLSVPGEFQYHYIAKEFHCIESNHKSPIAFLISDEERFGKAFREAAHSQDLRLISIFHSHPSGNRPSGTDLDNMKYLDKFGLKATKNQIWTIMDAKDKKIKGYMYLQKELIEVEVISQE